MLLLHQHGRDVSQELELFNCHHEAAEYGAVSEECHRTQETDPVSSSLELY